MIDKKWLIGIATSIVVIPTLTMSWKHAQRVWAAPTELDDVKAEQADIRAQTSIIGDYVEQQKKANEMMKKAPKGYRWEEAVQDFVAWPEDPRLKKR